LLVQPKSKSSVTDRCAIRARNQYCAAHLPRLRGSCGLSRIGARSRSQNEKKEITMSKMGRRLIAAAKEARAIARGEADPKTYFRSRPNLNNLRSQRILKSCGNRGA
jgi:hypothetical protein